MARPRKKEATAPNALLEALKFLALVTKDQGSLNETHIILANHFATAFNGVIAAGISIQEDIFACPQNSLMVKALSKCGQNIAITQINDSLSIKSEKFKAIIPCLEINLLQTAIPDPLIAAINDDFKTGLEIVGILANENAQSVVAASILMNGQSLIATDRNVIFEYWHGIDLPPGFALPKALVAPLTKARKKLTGFGNSATSVTFYFEDNSWIKSQLYNEHWPDMTPIWGRQSNPLPVPAGLWEALEAVAPFSGDGLIYSRDGGLASDSNSNAGAFYEAASIPPGLCLSARQLGLLKGLAREIDFFVEGPSIMFYGDRIRGLIAGRKA